LPNKIRDFLVRLMSPIGSYPARPFLEGSSALGVAPDICFSIVRRREEQGFSEIEFLKPEEIPLFAALLLCVEVGEAPILPYPTHHSLSLPAIDDQSLGDNNLIEAAALLRAKERTFDETSPTYAIHRPPAIGGSPYQFVPSENRDEDRRVVLRYLESAEPVYVRGTASLLKANMAWFHPEFAEAACLHLWIALDAAFNIVLQRLRAAGKPNPTSEDAANFVDQIYGTESPWEKFFQHDYYNRIETIHPVNKYSSEARPQLLADDFLELNDALVDLYYFFTTGIARARE
jgi:hypothetical protein